MRLGDVNVLILALLVFTTGCSNPIGYAERWSGVKINDELSDVTAFDRGFAESHVVVHGSYSGKDYREFVAKHGLTRNQFKRDWIEGRFGSVEEVSSAYRKSTSPGNIFMKSKHFEDSKVLVRIYLDSGNNSVWIAVTSGVP